MKRTREITKPKLFIEELELPAPASIARMVTTLAVGEEAAFGKGKGPVTTMAIGEEA